MKIKKNKTEPLSCRVPEEMKTQIEGIADSMDLSLAQYVAILVEMGFNGEITSPLVAKLKILEEELEERKHEVETLKKTQSYASDAFTEALEQVINNENVLKNLFSQNESPTIPREKLVNIGFKFNIMLEAKLLESKTYYFMGEYGWAFKDESRMNVMIKKRR